MPLFLKAADSAVTHCRFQFNICFCVKHAITKRWKSPITNIYTITYPSKIRALNSLSPLFSGLSEPPEERPCFILHLENPGNNAIHAFIVGSRHSYREVQLPRSAGRTRTVGDRHYGLLRRWVAPTSIRHVCFTIVFCFVEAEYFTPLFVFCID
jgi:hypothetical protein